MRSIEDIYKDKEKDLHFEEPRGALNSILQSTKPAGPFSSIQIPKSTIIKVLGVCLVSSIVLNIYLFQTSTDVLHIQSNEIHYIDTLTTKDSTKLQPQIELDTLHTIDTSKSMEVFKDKVLPPLSIKVENETSPIQVERNELKQEFVHEPITTINDSVVPKTDSAVSLYDKLLNQQKDSFDLFVPIESEGKIKVQKPKE